MILNDVELGLSQEAREKLIEALKTLKSDSSWLADIQRDSIAHQISELNEAIDYYRSLTNGHFQEIDELTIDKLPKYLVSSRITKGISQDKLAEHLNIPTKQLQALESEQYKGTSLSRILKILQFLGLNRFSVLDDSGDIIFDSCEESDFQWSSLPVKEMQKRGWIKKGENSIESAKQFIQGAFGLGLQPALHRKTSFKGKSAHAISLIAWQANILSNAEKLIKSHQVSQFEFNDSWIPELVSLSTQEDGPILARDFLESKGVILIYEPHLEGTYLDGAAMLSESGNPIIGMTIRHDRIDNFWFVLLHELGHVFLHLSQLGTEFIDENVGENSNSLEDQADAFALNNLIAPEAWKLSVSRVIATEAAIVGDAKRLGVNPAIIAGRLRKEKNDYSKFNNLIGYGKVRGQFE
ncbi:helix-turn-helix domain-containing protein [Vibrio gallaecicus]|uniref:Helix-turn-helix domain-containing protein n=1 Tax=Vibrio gallaecicus TaxID=552386 RepID=A0ABV4ND19_9VIBR